MGAWSVGLDTVSGLLENDVKPVVVELADHLLCRQLDKKSRCRLPGCHERKGSQAVLRHRCAGAVL